MIKVKHKGKFTLTTRFLEKLPFINYETILRKYGEKGVAALAAATPVDTGETAASWGYKIVQDDRGVSIVWTNSHVENGVNIAVILQYGHGTRNGGYVAGIDYINPAIKPVFESIASDVWKEVTA